FSSRRRHTRSKRDWSSDVCSSDLTEETVILLSHFDVVGIEDYGSLRNLAFHPIELTRELNQREDELPQEVARDLEKGNWLFGREIGRASCRERVRRAGGSGGVKRR